MPTTLASTPGIDGFHMPAEFERHDACWMLWPERASNWRRGAEPAQAAFCEVASVISSSERVIVGASAEHCARVRARLPPCIDVVELASDDAWMRDVGPTFVVNESLRRGVDWRFNAWGGLYADCTRDAEVARRVLEFHRCDRYAAPFILEGGAIHVDGQGTLITTEECMLSGTRNPTLSKEQIEDLLRSYLGVQKIIWLARGVSGDETEGHVDNVCCFAAPGELVLSWSDDPADPQYEISREALERLNGNCDARGRRFVIHKLIHPVPQYRTREEAAGITRGDGSMQRHEGAPLAASYVNFYIANSVVAAPLLGLDSDSYALRQIEALFPTRQVIGIRSREILLGGGNIHCITQQVPAVETHS